MDGLPLISSGNRWMGYIELDVILNSYVELTFP